MHRVRLPLLLLLLCLIPAPNLAAQQAWASFPMISPVTHQPMQWLHAIGIPATATCDGKKVRAYVFLWGRNKQTGLGYPTLGVYIERMGQLAPVGELNRFRGNNPSPDVLYATTLEVTITARRASERVNNRVLLEPSLLPVSIAPDDAEFFNTDVSMSRAELPQWKLFIQKMSWGFEWGHLSLGGSVLSKRIEVDFSGQGIGPVLQEMIRAVGP